MRVKRYTRFGEMDFPLTSKEVEEAYLEPSFDEEAAKKLFKEWAEPINRVILWAVPFIAIGALGYTWIKWSAKDEDEKEQRPFMKSAKKIIFTAIFVELGSAIFQIFGLNT